MTARMNPNTFILLFVLMSSVAYSENRQVIRFSDHSEGDERCTVALNPTQQSVSGATGVTQVFRINAFADDVPPNGWHGGWVSPTCAIVSGLGSVEAPLFYLPANVWTPFSVSLVPDLSMQPGETITGRIGILLSGGYAMATISISVVSHPCVNQVDQPESEVNHGGYPCFEVVNNPGLSVWIADDFSVQEAGYIERLFFPGVLINASDGDIRDALSLNWQIYRDDNGIPAGNPGGDGDPPIWSISLPASDPQVYCATGADGDVSDVLLTLNEPALISPGTFWIVFYPQTVSNQFIPFGRLASDTHNGQVAMFIDPAGSYGFGTGWQSWTCLGAPDSDSAFELCGGIGSPTPSPASPTPSPEPTRLPTPTPGCSDTGVTLVMPSTHFLPGMACYLDAGICNASGSALDGYPLFVILSLAGDYWYGPGFDRNPAHYGNIWPRFETGITHVTILPEFIWPEGAGSYRHAVFWGALVDPGMSEIIGTYDNWSFGWDE